MRKKGNVVATGIFIIIVIVVFAMVNTIGGNVFEDIYPSVDESLSMNESKQVLSDVDTRYPSVVDGLVLLLFGGLWLGAVVSGWVREEHPMLFGFMMILVCAVLISGILLSNSFEEFFNDPEYSGSATTYPATFWIITHLLEVGIGMLMTSLLVVMAKNRA